jgi:hypothetical protein
MVLLDGPSNHFKPVFAITNRYSGVDLTAFEMDALWLGGKRHDHLILRNQGEHDNVVYLVVNDVAVHLGALSFIFFL